MILRLVVCTLFLSISITVNSQTLCERQDTIFKVLHFTKTTGWDHNTRSASADLFETIGGFKGFTVTDTEDESIFNNLSTLIEYSVIIFSNTSGNQLFNTSQKDNFEAYIEQGGSFIGIHAATDTYRTGWPYYNEVVGGIVQTNPNHTPANHVNFMDHITPHETLTGIPNPWEKQEEYYYWDLNGGMVDTNTVTTILKVRETGDNSYDRKRPITWLHNLPQGGRSFYTALGHANSNYQDPGNYFSRLLSNAVCWTAYDKNVTSGNMPAVMIEDSNIMLDQSVLYFPDNNTGIIMKAPNGNCYEMTIDNDGNTSTILVTCPN